MKSSVSINDDCHDTQPDRNIWIYNEISITIAFYTCVSIETVFINVFSWNEIEICLLILLMF